MQYLLSRNYTKIQLCDSASEEYVSVMVSRNETENFRYGGTRLLQDVDATCGMLTYFRTNPSFRTSKMQSWNYTNDDATILAFVIESNVYIVVHSDNTPVLVKRDYAHFYPVENKPTTSNVYRLDDYRRF